ncbi:MAG TPA: type II toxin-antitoxin system PemK/MazF family toxin [Rhizomicrobium sp.]
MVAPHRFEVHLAALDPTIGSEIKKTRPCVVVSPDQANDALNTVVIAPLTSTLRDYPTRLRIRFQGRNGEIAVDQLRALDKRRLIKKLGKISPETQSRLTALLLEFFS